MKRTTLVESAIFIVVALGACLWVIYRDDNAAPRAAGAEQKESPQMGRAPIAHRTPQTLPLSPAEPLTPAELEEPRRKLTWNSSDPMHEGGRRGFQNWVRAYNITDAQQAAAMEAILDARENYERGYQAFLDDVKDVHVELRDGKPVIADPAFTEEDFIRLQTGEQGREEMYSRIREIAGEDAAAGFNGHVGVFAGFFLNKPFVPVTE